MKTAKFRLSVLGLVVIVLTNLLTTLSLGLADVALMVALPLVYMPLHELAHGLGFLRPADVRTLRIVRAPEAEVGRFEPKWAIKNAYLSVYWSYAVSDRWMTPRAYRRMVAMPLTLPVLSWIGAIGFDAPGLLLWMFVLLGGASADVPELILLHRDRVRPPLIVRSNVTARAASFITTEGVGVSSRWCRDGEAG